MLTIAALPALALPASATPAGRLSGVVRDEQGAGRPHAEVRLVDSAGGVAARATTGTSGQYSLSLPPGIYTVRVVTAPVGQRWVAQIRDVAVDSSSTLDIVVVAPYLTLMGTVRDGDGHPIGGATVSLGGSTTTTLADGTYALSARPGTYTLSATVQSDPVSFTASVAAVDLLADRRLDLTLAFTTMAVVVHDDHGAPVANAWTSLHSPYDCRTGCHPGFDLFRGATNTTATWGTGAHTAADGTAVLRTFPGDVVLSSQPPPGNTSLAATPDTFVSFPWPSPVNVVQRPPAPPAPPHPTVTFRGKLRDDTGTPLDATVHLDDPNTNSSSGAGGGASPGPDGSFEIPIAPGHYRLSVSGWLTHHSMSGDSGGPYPDLYLIVPDFDLTADRSQDLTVATRLVTVHVVDRHGQPSQQFVVGDSEAGPHVAGGGTVELFPGGQANGGLEDNAGSDATGTATLRALAGAAVGVGAGWHPTLGTATVASDATSTVVHLSNVTLSGTLRDARGALQGPTLNNAWVDLDYSPCGASSMPGLNQQSGYRLDRMPGDYKLCVSDTEPWDWGANNQMATATLPRLWSISTPYHLSGDRSLDLTVPDALPATIAVVDADGQPIKGRFALTATTTKADVPLAPGITGTGWVDTDTLVSDHGQFQPLLFGPSTTTGGFGVDGEPRYYGFTLPLAPGNQITFAIATPDGGPSAPREVRAQPGNQATTVTWLPPADDGAGPITAYLVTVTEPGTPYSTTMTVPGTHSSAIVDTFAGSNPNDYKIWVAAINTAGTGPATAANTAVTPSPTLTTTTTTTTTTAPPSTTTSSPTTTAPARPLTAPSSQPPAQQPASGVAWAGYWALGGDGHVYDFGDAPGLGDGQAGAINLEPTASGRGYWILHRNGHIRAVGDATSLGDVDMAKLTQGEEPTSLSATPSGKGYWVSTNRGRILVFGDAPFLGDMSTTNLNGPVLHSVATPTGKGYYMVASDGGIFAFGDATFAGSMGGRELNAPVQGLVPAAGGAGYWLVAADGGIFAFHSPFRGSMGARRLNRPITGMVRYGDGYLMVGQDGGIFNFSSLPFDGSLGDRPPTTPIVAVAAPPPATLTGGTTAAPPFGSAVRTTANLLPGVPEGGYANSFPYGQCAYWAALNHRVTWSGADWLASATAQGAATAQIPTVGAIAVWPPSNGYGPDGHVAVVTAVAPSSYTVSEMNYLGEGVVDARTIPWPDGRLPGFIP